MPSFTKEERLVLSLFVLVILCGSLLRFIGNKFPSLQERFGLTDSHLFYPKVDLNTASFDELVGIPYIGPYTAHQIIEYRRRNGPFVSIDQIKSVKGIKEKNYAKFYPFLRIEKSKKR